TDGVVWRLRPSGSRCGRSSAGPWLLALDKTIWAKACRRKARSTAAAGQEFWPALLHAAPGCLRTTNRCVPAQATRCGPKSTLSVRAVAC
ncbi:hypothetical protein LPJ77_006177, partial [Coemansia sp. RSA 2523]